MKYLMMKVHETVSGETIYDEKVCNDRPQR